MSTYPLKSLSKSRKELVVFTLEDGPVAIDNNFFILSNRPGTPILRYNNILKGSDVSGVFEGDILIHNNKRYIVTFDVGFSLVSKDKEVIPLSEIPEINVVSNVYFQNEFSNIDLRPVTFKFIDNEGFHKGKPLKFGMLSISKSISNKLLLSIYGRKFIELNRIQQYAGFRANGKMVYFGDTYKNGEVVLYRGRVCIRVRNQYYDIKRKQVIR